MSFASLCEFYSRGKLTDEGFLGARQRNGETVSYKISDDKAVIDFFAENGESDNIIELFAVKDEFWGQNLTKLPGFVAAASDMLSLIRKEGVVAAMKAATEASV